MVVDALRAYVQLASGLTDVTRERAVSAAKALVAQVGAMSDAPAESTAQVRALADELAKMARTNRDVVVGMVRSETERAVASVGAASHEELVALQRRVTALEAALSLHTDAPDAGASEEPLRTDAPDAVASGESLPTDEAAASKPADTKVAGKKGAGRKPAAKKASPAAPSDREATTDAETAAAPPDPAHATPADMPRHEPNHPVEPPHGDPAGDDDPSGDDLPGDDVPGDDVPADGDVPDSTADDSDPAAAPQDPSPPDVSTS